MKPFIRDGDYAISTRIFLSPRLGEVLIFRSPFDGEMMIKRVSRIYSEEGEERYYVEGDNRMRSTDSKAFGGISKKEVFGKVLFVLRRNVT